METNEAERTVERFAWLPVRRDDGRWMHLVWYLARERFEPDYGGWSTGWWVRIGATAIEEHQ